MTGRPTAGPYTRTARRLLILATVLLLGMQTALADLLQERLRHRLEVSATDGGLSVASSPVPGRQAMLGL